MMIGQIHKLKCKGSYKNGSLATFPKIISEFSKKVDLLCYIKANIIGSSELKYSHLLNPETTNFVKFNIKYLYNKIMNYA